MIPPLDIQDPYNINIYENYNYNYKKSHKKKYFCIGFMAVSLGYGLGILTCYLSDIC